MGRGPLFSANGLNVTDGKTTTIAGMEPALSYIAKDNLLARPRIYVVEPAWLW